MPGKALVIDANILVRAVLGKRVRELLETYYDVATFFVPRAAFAEAEEHLPELVVKRRGDPKKALADWKRDLRDRVGHRFLRMWSGCVEVQPRREHLLGSRIQSSSPRPKVGGRVAQRNRKIGQADPLNWA